MSNVFQSFSDQIASVVEQASRSVVQVQGHRRPAAGVVFAPQHILTPAATDDDRVTVHADGQALEGVVLGRAAAMGLAIVRVDGLTLPALAAAAEPKPGHLGIAVGRTWSGGVMATLAPVSVVGGPLRTGRSGSLDRVIRIQQAPHGALVGGALVNAAGEALGVITSMAIRGTTVVIPASLAWAAGSRGASDGTSKRAYLGVSSMAVSIPERQRGGRAQAFGLLVTHVAGGGPADNGGVLVGDVVVAFDGLVIQDPEELVGRLESSHIGRPVVLTVLRGGALLDLTVTVGERPRG